jgi:hypothetical protein
MMNQAERLAMMATVEVPKLRIVRSKAVPSTASGTPTRVRSRRFTRPATKPRMLPTR